MVALVSSHWRLVGSRLFDNRMSRTTFNKLTNYLKWHVAGWFGWPFHACPCRNSKEPVDEAQQARRYVDLILLKQLEKSFLYQAIH